MPPGITITFLILISIGIIMIVFILFLDKYSKKQEISTDLTQFDLLSEKQDNLIKTIDEADDAIEQLNGISKHIFSQQEEKYEELLYLYKIIDEKKKQLFEFDSKKSDIKVIDTYTNVDLDKENLVGTDSIPKVNKKEKKSIKSKPKYNDIMNLYNEGITVPEIAKKLKLGQGEVNLVIEFSKQNGENSDG